MRDAGAIWGGALRRVAAEGGSLPDDLGLTGSRAGAAPGLSDRPEPPGSGFSQSVARPPWTIAVKPGLLRLTLAAAGAGVQDLAMMTVLFVDGVELPSAYPVVAAG